MYFRIYTLQQFHEIGHSPIVIFIYFYLLFLLISRKCQSQGLAQANQGNLSSPCLSRAWQYQDHSESWTRKNRPQQFKRVVFRRARKVWKKKYLLGFCHPRRETERNRECNSCFYLCAYPSRKGDRWDERKTSSSSWMPLKSARVFMLTCFIFPSGF